MVHSVLPISSPRASIATKLTQPKKPGGHLVICDTFRSGEAEQMEHGDICYAATLKTGFEGVVAKAQRSYDYKLAAQVLNLRMIQIPAPGQSKEQILEGFDQFVILNSTEFLDGMSDTLKGLDEETPAGGVVNFSCSCSKAKTVQILLKESRRNPGCRDNLVTAFGLDGSALVSEDSSVRKEERLKLQQAVINRVSRTIDDSESVRQAKARWGSAVNDFEKDHRSVVVAAGNEGSFLVDLSRRTGYRAARVDSELTVSGDFYKNVLNVDPVTVVGAATVNGSGSGSVSEYSSPQSNVDLYASGGVFTNGGDFHIGTSFASPRVAATLATVHHNHPGFSSQQAEDWLLSKATVAMNGEQLLRDRDAQAVGS